VTTKAQVTKRLAELVDGTPWAMADLLLETFPVDEWGDAAHGTHTGLRVELDDYEDELRRDFGVELKAKTMREMRATAIAWPEAARAASAPYAVHRALRARSDRVGVLTKLVKRHHGHVTWRQFRDWQDTNRPKVPVPWSASMERRLRRVIADAETPAARRVVADLLDQLAGELRRE